jgi:hypothetical protein
LRVNLAQLEVQTGENSGKKLVTVSLLMLENGTRTRADAFTFRPNDMRLSRFYPENTDRSQNGMF